MLAFLRNCLHLGTDTSIKVFRLLIPTVIAVEILSYLGALQLLQNALEPLMAWLGLPAAFSIVWASALLTNLYSGVAVLALVLPEQQATVADVSVICTMMLIAHALPVESAVSHLLGVRWWFSAALRLLAALVLGFIISYSYQQFDYLQQPAAFFLFELAPADSIGAWVQNQIKQWLIIAGLIYALIFLNEALRACGIERWLRLSLAPVLALLGIGRAAAGVALVGCVLGITYGSALMVNEAKSGHIKAKDLVLVALFLNLTHALLEDTLLMIFAGAHLSAILWARLLFSWVLALLFYIIYDYFERRNWLRYFFNLDLNR